ncbi:MAG: DUF6265 family protein [Pseudomonadota bacterium]
MKRLSMLTALITLIFLGTALAGNAVEIRKLPLGEASPAASIEDVAWLAGHWRGEGLGGQSEEIMAPPLGRQMTGMFRQTNSDGALMFYEFYHIAEQDGSLILRIKHFNPDFTGWEEKDESVEFVLVAIEGETVYFDGLTFSVEDGRVLNAAVLLNGNEKAEFRYERLD